MNTQPVQVADVVIVRGDRVLLVQQRKAVAHGLWSYPGGHLEDGETPLQAAVREVQEELGVTLLRPKFFKAYAITTPREPLDITTFTGDFLGEIILKEDELMAYRWFTLEELRRSKISLRSPVVLDQAQDALSQPT